MENIKRATTKFPDMSKSNGRIPLQCFSRKHGNPDNYPSCQKKTIEFGIQFDVLGCAHFNLINFFQIEFRPISNTAQNCKDLEKIEITEILVSNQNLGKSVTFIICQVKSIYEIWQQVTFQTRRPNKFFF